MGEGLGWGWFDASGASPRHVAVTWSEPGGKLSFLDFPMLHCHMQPVAEHSALSVWPGRVWNPSGSAWALIPILPIATPYAGRFPN